MGRVWDILSTIENRVSEVKEELQAYRREMRLESPRGTVSIEGLQRLVAEEMPAMEQVLMAVLALQVALEHGSETEIFHARRRLIELRRQQDTSLGQSGHYRIAPHRLTDVVKVISAMYDDRMFITDDGMYASSKLDLMREIGTLFRQDFSSYSTLLSKAKASTKNYMDIFDTLRKKAHDYYYDQ